jgi:ElaB/YqjD/DUF883 family membrane-anchored ribosome-binding protein
MTGGHSHALRIPKGINMSTFSATASQLGLTISEMRDNVEDLGRAAGKMLDDARNETASAFHTAASSVRTTARNSSEKIDELATSAAGKLDATASYIQDHDMKSVIASVRHFLRWHPVRSLRLASGIGLFAGFAVRQVTHPCTRSKG